MKSASQMSMLIRAKKKKMQEDPDVVDLGGSPSMDLQDEAIADRDQETKRLGLDRNLPHPMEQSPKDWMDAQDSKHEKEEPLSDEARMMAEGGMADSENEAPLMKEHMDEAKAKRQARLAKMMGR